MKRWRIAFAAVGAATLLAAACTIADDLSVPPKAASPDGGDGGIRCASVTWPERPPSPENGAADVEMVVAGRLSFGQGDTVAGYDLDGLCSCDVLVDGGAPEPESCTPRAPRAQICDAPGGVDNSTRRMIGSLKSFYDLESSLQTTFAQGRGALLLRVQQYNGLADDGQVTVSLFGSAGLRDATVDGGYDPPRLDGSDAWTIDRKELINEATLASTNTSDGYVHDHVLVMRYEFEIVIGEGMSIKFRDGVLSAKIEPADGGGFTITSGTMAGGWATSDALRTLGLVVDTTTKGPFCDNPLFASLAKGNVCNLADLALSADGGAGATCDAISIGMSFAGFPAQIGPIVDVRTLTAQTCSNDAVLHCD